MEYFVLAVVINCDVCPVAEKVRKNTYLRGLEDA